MNDRYEGQTFYELLEVSPQAGPSEIYLAYQRARATYSPSSPALYSMFTPQEAQELMVLIEEAYQTLSHQARRSEYDQKMGISNKGTMKKPANNEPTVRASSDIWVGPVKVSRKPGDEIPKGFARTKFSVYEVKEDMEREIAAVEECDGQFLQRVRLYKGVTLEQMSDEIRVMKTTIAALEANNFSALPVAVFTRGFVVQMARVLGLDEAKIAAAYMKFFRAKNVVP
jgi:hypothetical protein